MQNRVVVEMRIERFHQRLKAVVDRDYNRVAQKAPRHQDLEIHDKRHQ